MSTPNYIVNDLQWYCLRCDQKMTFLLTRGQKREQRYRSLSFLLGILSLLSPLFTSLTLFISPLDSSMLAKLATAVIAFLSGVLGLYISIFCNPKETKIHFRGAEDFRGLRERFAKELHPSNRTPAQTIARADQCKKRYLKISGKYSRYLSSDQKKKDEQHERMMEEGQQIVLESPEIRKLS
jgi:hypothetical protein